MYKIWVLVKSHFKRLMRMPKIIFIVIVLPLLSIGLLNVTWVTEPDEEETIQNVMLEIWNASEEKDIERLSDQLRQQTGYNVVVTQVRPMSIGEAEKEIHGRIKEYSLKLYLYIPVDFKKRLQKGEEAVFLFDAGYDERVEEVKKYVSISLADMIEDSKTQIEEKQLKKFFVNKQGEAYDRIYNSYSFSLHMFIGALVVCFVLSNISVLELWRDKHETEIEQRIQLSGIEPYAYELSKFVTLLIVVVIECIVTGIGIKLIGKESIGIPLGSFMWIVLLLGFVLLCFSLLVEVCFHRGNNAVYANVFSVVVCNFFSGIYFPFIEPYGWQEHIAILLPQYEAIYAIKAIRQGKLSVLILFSCIMLSLAMLELLLTVKLKASYSFTKIEESN